MKKRPTNSGYPSELVERTRQVIEDIDMASFMNQMRCHLKRIEKPSHGYLTIQNAIARSYVVQILDGDGEIAYPSVEALVSDGWVVD